MLPGRVSNPGPLTYESGALPIALRGPASFLVNIGKEMSLPGFRIIVLSTLSRPVRCNRGVCEVGKKI